MKYLSSEILTKVSGIAFVVSSFAPFFGFPQFDSQPFPVVLGFLFVTLLFCGDGSVFVQKKLIWFSVFVIAGCIGAAIKDGDINFLTVRAVIGYAAIPVFYVAFYNYLQRYGFPSKLAYLALLIWIVVGIIQLFDPDIVSRFVALRTTHDRGVTSLSPEPTYFAMFLYFLCWLILISNDYKFDWKSGFVCILGLIGALGLAKSSMIVIFLVLTALAIVFNLLLNKKYRLAFFVSFFVLSIFLISFFALNGANRLATLKTAILNDGLMGLVTDQSTNRRLSNIVIPLYALFDNNFMPGGFLNFSKEGLLAASRLAPIFPYGYDEKIMSWNSAMWYQLGAFGFAAWVSLVALVYKKGVCQQVDSILLFTLLFSAIPHLFPLPVMVMVLSRFMYDAKTQNSND